MQKVTFWLLAIGAFLVVIALAVIGFNRKQTSKPESGSPEQMAQAREAKAIKKMLKDETPETDEIQDIKPENQ